MLQIGSLLGISVFRTILKQRKKRNRLPAIIGPAHPPTHSLNLISSSAALCSTWQTCVQLISLSALLFLHLTASTVSFLPFRVPPCSIYSNNTAWPAFLDIHVVIHRLSLYLFVYVHVLRVGLQLGTLHCMYIDYIYLVMFGLVVCGVPSRVVSSPSRLGLM